MNALHPAYERSTSLVRSMRTLTSDVIDYGEARIRLIRAELRDSLERLGGAAGMVVIAAMLALIGYLFLMAFFSVLLSTLWFNGQMVWPLAFIAFGHLILSASLALFAKDRWERGIEINQESNHS